MKYTQDEYDEAIKDQNLIDDLNAAIKKLIIEVKDNLGGYSFKLSDDLEEIIYDFTNEMFAPRTVKMRRILEGGNPLYQTVTYINEHGGYYDC